MPPACGRARHGFTLIELITTLLIAGLLMAALGYTFYNVYDSASAHRGPTLLAAVDAAARQAASENSAGYSFPVIGADCPTNTPSSVTTVPVSGATIDGGLSSGPTDVSACVDPGSDTLYLAVSNTGGTCSVAADTITATALPPVLTSPSTTAVSSGDGPRYGTAQTTTCSAQALYQFYSAGNQLTSTNAAAPEQVAFSS